MIHQQPRIAATTTSRRDGRWNQPAGRETSMAAAAGRSSMCSATSDAQRQGTPRTIASSFSTVGKEQRTGCRSWRAATVRRAGTPAGSAVDADDLRTHLLGHRG